MHTAHLRVARFNKAIPIKRFERSTYLGPNTEEGKEMGITRLEWVTEPICGVVIVDGAGITHVVPAANVSDVILEETEEEKETRRTLVSRAALP